MLPFEKALDTVLSSARLLGAESVDITDAANRVLAEDVKSDMDIPPFNKSAMDGYACRRADLANDLEVIEIIPAGCAPTKSVGPGQCAKIMTGAVVPEGADCVVMKEYIADCRLPIADSPIANRKSKMHLPSALSAKRRKIIFVKRAKTSKPVTLSCAKVSCSSRSILRFSPRSVAPDQ